jgi:hypothetical protein
MKLRWCGSKGKVEVEEAEIYAKEMVYVSWKPQ